MPSSRIPSPARSQGVISTPRRHKIRRSRSVSSPTPKNMSVRLSTLVTDSYKVSPMPNRQSVLTDETDIEIQPGRKSWWKKLGENSRDVMDVLESKDLAEIKNVADEFDVEVLSQEKHNYTLDLPDSSDGESISSIVIPQRKLFTQKENNPQKKFAQIMKNRDSEKHRSHVETVKDIEIAPKNLFKQPKQRSKPVFPSGLLNISANKTLNKTKEMQAPELKSQVRSIFGNRPAAKRKNMFADFIVSDSEDDIPDIQPKVFAFKKNVEEKRRESTSSRAQHHSPTSSLDLEMDEWKLLPSSTMMGNQLEDITPVKRARLSKLSEVKESETISTINKTKQSNKSMESKNKSKISSNSKLKEIEALQQQDVVMEEEPNLSNSRLTRNRSKSLRESSLVKANRSKTGNISKNITMKDKSIANKTSPNNNPENIVQNISVKLSLDEVEGSDKNEYNDNEDFSLQYENDEENVENDKSNNTNKKLENKNYIETHLNNKTNVVQEKQKYQEKINNTNNKNKSINKSYRLETNEDVVDGECTAIASNNQKVQNVNVDKQSIISNIEVTEKVTDTANISVHNISNKRNNTTNKVNKSFHFKNNISNQSETKDVNNQSSRNNDKNIKESVNDDQNKEVGKNNDEMEMDESEEGDRSDSENQTESRESENESDEQNEQIESEQEQNESEIKQNDNEEENVSNEVQDENESDEEQENEVSENQPDDDNEDEFDESEKEITSERNLSENKETSNNYNEQNESQNEETDNDNNEQRESAIEENENDEQIKNDDQNESLNKDNVAKNNESVNDNNESPNIEKERRENLEGITSPEAILHDKTNQIDSFTAQGRNTTARKTKSILIKNLNIRPSLAPVRESTGFSDGTKDSSADNSGWDSHRTTRKTLRQTFGKDFTLRKSLRALVMEKSAKRNTNFLEKADLTEIDNTKAPQANSTEFPHFDTYVEEPMHVDETPDEVSEDNEEPVKPNEESEEHDNAQDHEEFHEHVESDYQEETEELDDREDQEGHEETEDHEEHNESEEHDDTEELVDCEDTEELDDREETEDHEVANESEDHEETKELHDREDDEEIDDHEEHEEHEESEDHEVANGSEEHEETEELDDREEDEPQVEHEEFEEHEVSKKTSKATLELPLCLQKLKEEMLKKNRKIEEQVRNSIKITQQYNPYKMPLKPVSRKKTIEKSKKKEKNIIVEYLPAEILEDMKYKPPKRFQPTNASWVTKRLYKFLETKLEPKYDYKARVRAEKLVETIYNFTKDIRKHDIAPSHSVDVLKQEMARLDIVKTHFDFYDFIGNYMPREIRIKVIPDVVNNISLPKHGVFTDIIR